MPGGQWEQSSKWNSHDLNSSHYTNLRREARKNWSNDGNESFNKKGMLECVEKVCLHGRNASSVAWTQMMRGYLANTQIACNNINQQSNARSMLCHLNVMPNLTVHRMYSDKKVKSSEEVSTKETAPSEQKVENNKPINAVALSPREKLKNAVKDYGATVIVFHVAISLASLGFFYQLVSR